MNNIKESTITDGNSYSYLQNGYSTATILWILFFCYSTFVALIFQKLLLPLIPSLHGSSGLMNTDSIRFHSIAISLAQSINEYGWSAWSIYPAANTTGNVAVLGALYAIFGYDPALIIPINAAIHATGGLLIYKLSRELFPGRTGTHAGIIASVLFVGFPSSLNWYAQVHKDGYNILGTLIILYSWVKGLENRSKLYSSLWIIFGTATGMVFVVFVRPYNLKLLSIAAALVFLIVLFYVIFSKSLKNRGDLAGSFLFAIIVLVIGYSYTAHLDKSESDFIKSINQLKTDWIWHNSSLMPDKIERQIENASSLRVLNIAYGESIEAGSLIDNDSKPDDIFSVAAYMPRALQISLLAPFPSKWFETFKISRMVAVFEMIIWYLIIPGIFLSLFYRRTPVIVVCIVVSLFFLSIYGFAFPNVGTLYRIRYPYIFILIILGLSGWITVLIKDKYISDSNNSITGHNSFAGDNHSHVSNGYSRLSIAYSGINVIILTVVSYTGFFIRDMLMARTFGLGDDLDSFFIAMILPMFFVSLFCVPLGTIIIPTFLDSKEKISFQNAQKLISNVSFIITTFLVFICIVLFLSGPYLLRFVGGGFSPDKIAYSTKILIWTLPLLFFSGIVIIGNSVLNAVGKFAVPSLAQAAVPVAAILVLVFFSEKMGVLAVAIGMLVGQLINLFLVAIALKKEGISLVPKWNSNTASMCPLFSQYTPLVVAAFFVSASIPVNNAMASSLSIGSVGALNLGNKFVLSVIGIIGTGIATVMLPYFSSFVAKNRLFEVRHELSLFLYFSTIISIPVSIIIYLASDEIVRMVFQGGVFTSDNAVIVARVMKFGIIQLPFFTCNILILKFATATRHTSLIMLASVAGLLLNIILNNILMGHMGVAGISLAATISMMVVTFVFAILIYKLGHVSWIDIITMALNWMLYLTVILCFHYKSYAGVCVSVFALLLLGAGHLKISIGRFFYLRSPDI